MAFIGVVLLQLACVIIGMMILAEIIYTNPLLEGKYLFVALCGSILHSAGYLMEICSTDMSMAMMAIRFEYLGLCFGFLMLMLYTFKACRAKISPIVKAILIIVNFITCFLVFTTGFIDHKLYYRTMELVNEGIFPHVVTTKGPFYWVHIATMVAMMVLLVTITVIKFSVAARTERRDSKFLSTVILFGTISVIIVILYVTGCLKYYDPTPVLFTTMCVFIRFNVYDIGESAMQIATDSINEGIVVVDKNFMYIDCNNEAKKIFPEFEHGNFERKRIGLYVPILEDIFVTQSNHEFKIKDRYYRATVIPVAAKNTNKVTGYAACIIDFTDNHFNVRKLVEMKNKADNANKAKSEFLANVSHEIRTPMNSVLGMAELALREDMNDSVREKIYDIKSAGETLLTIINEILDFSKIEANKMEVENVNYHIPSLIMDVTNIIVIRLAEKNIKFDIEVDPTIPNLLSGDEKKLKQILINLLGNAVKYTQKGTVTFVLGWERQGTTAVLKGEVRDTGVGIPEKEIGKLFQSFQRIDSRKNRSIEGAGLGLTITKSYIELMGGSIRVESVYGQGTSFFFTVPQRIIDETPCRYDPNKGRTLKKTFVNSFFAPEAKILVVDDNQTNLKIASGFLKTYKISPDTALSGKECLEMVDKTHYDIIFLDYMMPVLDGIDTLQLIRSKKTDDDYYGEVPIIALTADSVNGAEKKFMAVGFQGYISKPIDAEKLEDTLAIFLPPELVEINDSAFEEETAEEEPLSRPDISIDGVDIAEGIYNTGGNPDDYIEVIKIFHEFGAEKLSKIQKHFDEKNIGDYTTEVLSLKSSAANIGAMELSALAKELEFAGKDNKLDIIESKTGRLLEMFSKLLNDIGTVLEDRNNK